MKPIDLPTRARMHQQGKAVLKLIEEGKAAEAEKAIAEVRKDVGLTCLFTGLGARVELLKGNKEAAREQLKAALSMSAAGDVMFNRLALGLAKDLGEDALLESAFDVALRNTPSDSQIRYAAGGYFYRRGDVGAATRHYEAAVNLKPRFVQGMRDLALVYWEEGERERAIRVLKRGKEFDSDIKTKALEVGNARYGLRNLEGAVMAYEMVIAFEPEYSACYSNLGSVFRQLHEYGKSRKALKKAAITEPENSGAYYNLGNLEKEAACLDESIKAFRRAIFLKPDSAQFHWNCALALLADGALGEGFREYEWRWKTSTFPTKKRDFKQPEWDGTPLEGRTLLVIAEQGIGDALQFLRFLPDAVRKAQSGKKKGKIILEAHEEVLDLYAEYADIVDLAPRKPGVEPEFDLHVAQLSLPLLLGTETVDDLPKAPYINSIGPERFPVPDLDPKKLNVGVVWGGNPAFPGDDIRSSRIEHYGPFFELEGVQCYSLQKGPRENDLANAPPSLVRLSPDIKSFADTVSIVRQLDVTVTTCTSVAHLVGGMGCPVFVLLSHNPDWRWLQHRDDSPWYPSARLFRQSVPGDWAGVVARASEALVKLREEKTDK
ncbi:tetratricopeptide repeat protein [Nisaea acidiphila]|uniref:Tetratricopeptide repeat protein n=1 Tax=Nisaea acidiphila TaxID=1862145 RepID=A0A9J7AML0_9PROT|nr:tetratricopeptide repeat protein [Nisaea acidiphila]UUX48398.1 tetratricopeptide repeat protein [Nisaea acidiphila]